MEEFGNINGNSTRIKSVLFLLTFLFFLVISTSALERLGIYLFNGQINALTLSALLVLVLLYVPASQKHTNKFLRSLDFVLIGATLAFTTYYVVFFESFMTRFGLAQGTLELVLGALVMLVTFETTRRTMGLAMLVVVAVFTVYPFIADMAPGLLNTTSSSPFEFVGQVWLSETGIFGTIATIVPEFIFPFLLFAAALSISGAGNFFKDLSLSLAGRSTGGTAKAAVLANYFIGMISGSSAADVSVTGPLFIPMMKRTGYSGEYSGGVIAASSTAAQLSPPVMGAVAFIMAQILGVPYIKIALISIIPTFLYYLALLMIVHFDSAKLKLGMLSTEEVPRARDVMARGWYNLVPIAILVGMLIARQPPRYAAFGAVLAIIAISWLRKKNIIGIRSLRKMEEETIGSMTTMGPVIGAAGTIIGVIGLTALAFKMSTGLIDMAGGNLYIVLIMGALACLILGIGLPTIPAYIIVSVMLAPVLSQMGVPPLTSHMFVFYFGLAAMLTPPECLPVYLVLPLTGSGMWRTGLAATRLGVATFIVPFLFVADPNLLYTNNIQGTAMGLVAAALVTASLAIGLSGYLARSVNWPMRILLLAAIVPTMTPVPFVIKLGAGLPFVLLLLWQLVIRRNAPSLEFQVEK